MFYSAGTKPQIYSCGVGVSWHPGTHHTTLTVGSALVARDFPWFVSILPIISSQTTCHTADIKPNLKLGYPCIGSFPEFRDFQTPFSNKVRNMLFLIRMDFLAPGNALVYFRAAGRWLATAAGNSCSVWIKKGQISRPNFLCCKPEILLPTYTLLLKLRDPWMKISAYYYIIFVPCTMSRPEFSPEASFLKHSQLHSVWHSWINSESLFLKQIPLHIH